MISYFLRWTLLKIFNSFPDNQCQQKVWQRGRITRTVINAPEGVKCLLLQKSWIYNYSWIILEGILVGSIVNIRNECLFLWVHGEWIVARNKQIVREPLHKLWRRLKFWKSRSNLKVKPLKVTRSKLRNYVNGLVTRNAHMQYLSPSSSSGLKAMAKVIVF